ncbi:MAG: hypothetical protein VW985_06645 [Gammaproteobacteria bacterium]
MVRQLASALLVFLAVTGLPVNAISEPELPAPPQATVEIVAAASSMNGAPITTRKFSVESSVEEVLEFYRKEWAKPIDGHPGFVEGRLNQWQIISRIDGDFLLTVQVREPQYGHASGFLSVSDFRKRTRVLSSKTFPLMRDSVVVNDITSDDPGKRGRTFLVRNEFSIRSNAAYYRDHYLHRGWQPDFDQPLKGGHVLTFKRGGETVNIVVQSFGEGTYIVANTVKNTLF